jgi:transposase
MDFVGIDLHKTSSQICIINDEGELIERRIKSTRSSLDEVFSGWPRARILVEASTESEWVACHLEQLGHEIIVADPNFAPPRSAILTRRQVALSLPWSRR